MRVCIKTPYLKCGQIIDNDNQETYTFPIDLAKVNVSIKENMSYVILINYSQNLEFTFENENPILSIQYQLIRKSQNEIKVLEVWTYKVEEVIPTQVMEVDTIEPLILNYCDEVKNLYQRDIEYIVQIKDVVTQNTSFEISNQELSAIITEDTNIS